MWEYLSSNLWHTRLAAFCLNRQSFKWLIVMNCMNFRMEHRSQSLIFFVFLTFTCLLTDNPNSGSYGMTTSRGSQMNFLLIHNFNFTQLALGWKSCQSAALRKWGWLSHLMWLIEPKYSLIRRYSAAFLWQLISKLRIDCKGRVQSERFCITKGSLSICTSHVCCVGIISQKINT